MTLNLTAGKRDAAKLATLLEELAEAGVDSEEAALALLKRAWEIYEEKSKYVVLGALYKDQRGKADPVMGERVCFGPYGTETQARNAAAQLFYSTSTGEEFLRWLLPIHHGTPAAWFRGRKVAREEAEAAADGGYTKGIPPHHQLDPERRAAAQAAADERVRRNNEHWERLTRLRDHQQEEDPEVPRIREENAA